jgi:hexosaminidase
MKTNPADIFSIDPEYFQFKIDALSPQNCELIDLAFKRYFDLTFDQSCWKWTPDKHKHASLGRKSKLCGSQGSASGNNIICAEDYGDEDYDETKPRRKQLENLTVSYRFCESFPYEGMDEMYTLMIGDRVRGKSILFADTVWGVLRGLETFSQMVYRDDEDDKTFKVQASSILDFPRFSYRGLMIDTARHYIPVNVIKQNLDAMAYNKMNVFHWHVVDDQSFPYVSQRFPDLHIKGAYNHKTHIYTPRMVKDIIEFARIRGIRVIPEFDSPGHTLSWGKGKQELLSVCYDNETLLPLGTFGPIDPTRDSTYHFMREFYAEVTSVFQDSVIHLGGDEVDYECWKSNPDITLFMEAYNITTYEKLESYYMERLMGIIEQLERKVIVWQDVFDNKHKIDKDRTYIHVWKGWTPDEWQKELNAVTKAGMKAILSSTYYLNHLRYGIDWPDFYQHEPITFNGTEEQNDLVIGGSVCMWSEYVDGTGIMTRTWPRASAVAEKLWSAKEVKDLTSAAARIQKMQCVMKRRGLRVEPINGPGYCLCDDLTE